jgi:8-amino-7-oxononanoate synthase
MTVFCGNDYLGLRFHPDLIRAAADAPCIHGTGAGASRLVSGNQPIHEEAEQALAALVHRPAALLAATGFGANLGTVAALLGADDVVFSDALNHASIIDGCRLSRARVAVYPHADVDALAELVRRHRPFRRGWVLTESIFSMDGDLAPLAELRALCDREGLHFYVDDAHALGIFGPNGEGAVFEAGIDTDVYVGTLGKAFGAAGAFVAGSESLRLYLWNQVRSFVFSTGIAPPVAATVARAASLVRQSHDLREQLQRNIDRLRQRLHEAGIVVGGHPRAPIVPLLVGDEARTVALSNALKSDGLFVQAIRPPTVPPNTARLRITLSASHTADEIDALVDSLARHR